MNINQHQDSMYSKQNEMSHKNFILNNSSTKQKFKFDLNKFNQNQDNNTNEKSIKNNSKLNIESSSSENKNDKQIKLLDKDFEENYHLSPIKAQSDIKENRYNDFTVLERNKMRKFLNIDKNKNSNPINNDFTYSMKLKFTNFGKDKEMDYENLNPNNESINSPKSEKKKLTSRDFESPLKQHTNNLINKQVDQSNRSKNILDLNMSKKIKFIENNFGFDEIKNEISATNQREDLFSKNTNEVFDRINSNNNSSNNIDYFNESPSKRSQNFVFNLNKMNNLDLSNKPNVKSYNSNSKNSLIRPMAKSNEEVDFEMNIKKSQNYLFNSKKFLKSKSISMKINESDLILKNEELKEEFLNENNLILESKIEKNKQNLIINSPFTKRSAPEIECRRMMIELVKLKMKMENKRKPISVLNSLKFDVGILDSKPLKYSNNNYRKSYGNLHKVNNKKYMDLGNSDSKMGKNYNTGYLISNFNPNNNNFQENIDSDNSINNNIYNINIINNFNNNFNIYDSSNNSSMNIDYFDNFSLLTSSQSQNRTNTINLSLEDTLNDKINFLCYLATPRILKVKKNKNEIISYIFILVPSELCQSQFIEHYLFQWSDIGSMIQVGYIDTLKINHCDIKSDNSFMIRLSDSNQFGKVNPNYAINANNEFNTDDKLEIIGNTKEECKLLVEYLNLVSNLVKSKFYSNNANKILISNY